MVEMFLFVGSALYNFFVGRELNPRIGSVDLKFVSSRPGLIGWIMLNFIFVAKSFVENGGKPDPALLVVTGFQTYYVAEAFWCEVNVLSIFSVKR